MRILRALTLVTLSSSLLGASHVGKDWGSERQSYRDPVTQLHIRELTAPGTVEGQPLLPSFLYLPHADEFPPGELTLPWRAEGSSVVGELARSRGATTPIRLVSSAKSWLSHAGVDRRGAILPPAGSRRDAARTP